MSIEYRKDNHWRFRVRFEGRNYTLKYFSEKSPKMKDGKPVIPVEVEKAHSAFVVDVQRGEIGLNGNMTFKEFCELYKTEYLSKLEGATQISYDNTIDNHLLPMFGNKKMNEIKTIDIQMFLNSKEKDKNANGNNENLSSHTIKLHYTHLRAILNKAVAWDIIESNPCKNIKLPKIIKKNLTQIYSSQDLKKLIDAINNLDNLMYKALLSLLLFGGFRKGEAFALTIDDIDFKENSVNINKQYTSCKNENGKTEYKIKNYTKSDNGIRKVYMPSFAMNNVKEYIQSMPYLFNKYLFWNFNANKIYNRNTAGYALDDLLKKSDLKHIKVHALRHLNATMLINNGVNIVAVAQNLGDTVKTVTDTYVHDIEDIRKETANKLESYVCNLA